jgi:hypothetical protein
LDKTLYQRRALPPDLDRVPEDLFVPPPRELLAGERELDRPDFTAGRDLLPDDRLVRVAGLYPVLPERLFEVRFGATLFVLRFVLDPRV